MTTAERGITRDRRLIGELLLEAGIVTRAGLDRGLEEQRRRGGRLGYHLLALGRVVPAELHVFLKRTLPVLDPDLLDILRTAPAVDLLPARIAHYYDMIPLRVEDGVLALAVTSADAPRVITAVEELTGLKVDPIVCPPAFVASALARFYPREADPGILVEPPGDTVFVLSDRGRGLRPPLFEAVRESAPPADWLRAAVAEAIRCGSRRLVIEPLRDGARVRLAGGRDEPASLALPAGACPGLLKLLEALSRITARGRIAPREGRFAIQVEKRRLRAVVTMLAGVEGDTGVVDLRDERPSAPSRAELESDHPALATVLDRLAEERRGLLLVAGPAPGDIASGIAAVLEMLGGRLPARHVLDDDAGGRREAGAASGVAEEPDDDAAGQMPLRARLAGVVARGADLLVLPALDSAGCADAARDQARQRVVLASLQASDAFAAAERLASAFGAGHDEAALAGIVGARLLETLCADCAHPVQVEEIVALGPRPRPRGVARAPWRTARGCDACRRSGVLSLHPVFEFLAPDPGVPLVRPGAGGAALRRERLERGMKTLYLAALEKAEAGIVDVREPLRLLLDEPS